MLVPRSIEQLDRQPFSPYMAPVTTIGVEEFDPWIELTSR
jgi:hypothetical protein